MSAIHTATGYDISNVTIEQNYISDCKGKTGVDTDGSQTDLPNNNFRITPVVGAGCGW